MARRLILRSSVFRHGIENRLCPLYNHLRPTSLGTLISSAKTLDPSPLSKFSINSPLFTSAAISSSLLSNFPPFQNSRSLCSASGPSNIVLVKSEEEFTNILGKVQDKSFPAVLYFTAVWCGPCRFISPVIEELSEKYPHVTTYKIDIDEEAIHGTLGKLNISAVPTFQFYQSGKKADEIVGADVARLKDTMDKLYKEN
ncbi:hypothetical protein L6164_017000 [Bauhinia variegata]|uniref:Uncharacterized protein n=1 Tax=Bauhinia variegata TaxID=167791 RepID=A0ACB9N719_BAUVA|nr:hypothetical protein L6164_017000 [Bauhinia variegata]